MNTRTFAACVLLICTACQSGQGSAPAIRVAPPPAPAQTLGPTPTYNIVTLVIPTRSSETSTATGGTLDVTSDGTPDPTSQPVASWTPAATGSRPLILPRLLQADYIPQVTRLVIGFDIHPAYRDKPGVFGEIYDAKLSDQTGREISGRSAEMTAPEKATLEFAPLPAGVTALTLRAEMVLHGVPAMVPLILDVSGHPLDQPWPIQARLHFGDLVVHLHTARLLREESGSAPNAKQQVILELRGDNTEMDGAKLFCLAFSPLPPPAEGSMGCGQEPDGISSTVSLGPAIDRYAFLPMPTGPVTLQATADFLLPGAWETTWPVEK